MEYFRKDELDEIRHSYSDGTDCIPLYVVYKSLCHPVFKIKNMSKKYIYWEDGSKHPYPSKSAGYTIFDNQSEAWRKYKYLYEKQKQFIEDEYIHNMKRLNFATAVLNECAEKTPEYFF